MKKHWPWCKTLVAVLACLIFMGCSGSTPPSPTTLRINNSTSFDCQDIQWGGHDFGAIASGYYVVMNVNPGTDYVYILFTGLWFRTVSAVTVGSGQQIVFTLTDATLITGPLNAGVEREAEAGDMIRSIQSGE
jgi:hypothetical protein